MATIPPPAPTPFPWVDIVIILALVALNGVFAMSELAIVSARRPRLQAMEKAGRSGARVALELAADPGRFLSTVQIGITLIGIVAGAYSGASLGGPVSERLQGLGMTPNLAENAGFALVIGLIAILVVLGVAAKMLKNKSAATKTPKMESIAQPVSVTQIDTVSAESTTVGHVELAQKTEVTVEEETKI